MRNNDFATTGGAKKFLYTGPKKDQDEEDTIQWNFNAKNTPRTGNLNKGSNMDDVWSIKRNVNIGGNKEKDSLHFNTNKSYYSRYGGGGGGGGRDNEEFGASNGGSMNSTGNTKTDSSNKGWNAGNQSRRPFSYAFGSNPTNPQEPPVSPRNVISSESGTFTQGNLVNAGMNSTNYSSFGARNNFSGQNGNSFSSNTKSVSSPVNQPFSPSQPKTMNSMFLHQPSSPKRGSGANNSSLLNNNSDAQKKSFW